MRHQCSVKGFTLVELMVAMAVGALLLAALLSVLSSSLAVSRKTNDSLLASNAAAAALDLIGTDLESLAVIASGTFQHLYLGSEPVGSGTAAKIILLTNSPNDTATSGSNSAQVRAVVYRLAYQDVVNPTGANKIYGIYRSAETDSAKVFADYLGKTDLSATTLWTDAPSANDFLAGNIVDFRVRFYPAGSLAALNPSTNDILKIDGCGVATVGASLSSAATAEISITYLEDAGAKLLQKGLPLDKVKARYGYTVSKKVLLRTPAAP